MDLIHNSQHDFLFLFSCFPPLSSHTTPRDRWIPCHEGPSHLKFISDRGKKNPVRKTNISVVLLEDSIDSLYSIDSM